MFESREILCKHAIVVLMRNGIRLIPEKYILRRWRKDVTRPHTKVKVSFSCWELNEPSLRYNQMFLKFSVLADLASVSDEQSKVVNEWLDNRIEELKAKSIELEKTKMNAEDQGDTSAPSYRDPAKKKCRGRKRTKRLKANRSRKRTKTKPSQDIITNIPDPSLNDMHMIQESVATPTPSNPHDISHQQLSEATRGRGTRGRGTRGRGTRGTGTRGRGRGTHAHTNAPQVNNSSSSFPALGMYMPVPAEAPFINPACVSSWNSPQCCAHFVTIFSFLLVSPLTNMFF
ncbi:hypothetical protein MKW92_027803 [Papaver armeniacum]|nr:hypothetical protein MKW92_027803 [Papaver armeniacum]